MYIDAYTGPWNIRMGKQIVFWSEVEMVRTIDRINPLDLRYTTPGIDPFDEMKLGLWMVRGFYTSDLPGQLVFEGIWTPDFQRVRTPLEGTAMGSNPGPQGPEKLRPRAYGQNAAIDTMFRHDMPDISLKNTTFAFRVKGTSQLPYNYLLDWSLSWYHGMNTTPVARGKTLGDISSVDPNTLNGFSGRENERDEFEAAFAFLPGRLYRLEVRSPHFFPNETPGNNDQRRLGLAVFSIAILA